jgi:hypothetical protein
MFPKNTACLNQDAPEGEATNIPEAVAENNENCDTLPEDPIQD